MSQKQNIIYATNLANNLFQKAAISLLYYMAKYVKYC